MPLPDSPWTQGKCALKALQYMAVGIPAVVSDVGINSEAVLDGECGFVVRNESEWMDRIQTLLSNRALRRQLGDSARK
ncbi:MAG: glycosyltransferase, partial [Chloroflexi bacterium]|nr:glycosyltransferase [Chloroflexota bacterium]